VRGKGFKNTYEDPSYAAAYAKLEFPGTYYLAFRDLPRIILEHVKRGRALDFGCGAGRSTRFLRECGFDVVGVDIAEDMIRRARALDPAGDYRLIADGYLTPFPDAAFDVVLSAFAFDNIPTMAKKVALVSGIERLLTGEGRFVNLVSSPEIYTNEWLSFSTRDFPGNRQARSGDVVRIVNTAIGHSAPAEDILWTDEDYREVFARAGLELENRYAPLGRDDEPFAWVNETRIAPWVVYVLRKERVRGKR
jgi:SAM-dependent methyltransferase